VNSCLLVDTEADALAFPTGDLELAVCHPCGFVYNTLADPHRSTYSDLYEETQGYSARFREFARSLAGRWVDKYDIHGRDILEVGCGKGEFLALMCEIGGNRGVGVDPSAIPERLQTAADVTLLPEFFAEKHAEIPADVVVCRHTLEHIGPVADFVRLIRRVIGDRSRTTVLFELPDVMRVLREAAFWDVYYEHCSYFTAGSLARLFRRCGFRVKHVELDYDGQYILLEATPADVPTGPAGPAEGTPLPVEESAADVVAAARDFGADVDKLVGRWQADLAVARVAGRRVAIWGGGSKGVSFLTTIGRAESGSFVEYAVDVNPRKQGRFLAGTGHRVLGPADLPRQRPDVVVAMNAIYAAEIRAELDRLGVAADLRTV
jgi:SAM-dependent methyltransferase